MLQQQWKELAECLNEAGIATDEQTARLVHAMQRKADVERRKREQLLALRAAHRAGRPWYKRLFSP